MNFREFENEDAEFCFRVRSSAFIEKFYNEIGAEAVSLGVNAYMPGDYIRMSSFMKIFIVEEENQKVGFLTLKKIDEHRAEIPFIYFDLKEIGLGYGSKSLKFLEDWVKDNWRGVNTIFLDTIIPIYNSGFYKKTGYKEIGKSTCKFFDKEIPAVRFEKRINK